MSRKAMAMLGWLAAVVIATAVGLAGVSLLEDGLTSASMTPLSQDAVAKALASPTTKRHGTLPTTASSRPNSARRRSPSSITSPTTHPSPSTSASSATSAQTRSFSSKAGSVIARCDGRLAYLVSWSPAQGWSVDEHARGPAQSTLVRFDGSGEWDDLEVTMAVTCQSGMPVVAVVTIDD